MKEAKCVVWDLDNTLWDGTLSESPDVVLKKNIENILQELDSRGILQSIASKNNHDCAMKKLQDFHIDQYFLYPEINWNAKSQSIKNIQKNLNIGMDTFIFIDDQEFERDEVKSENTEIECINASCYAELLFYPRLNPKFITKDSLRRRLMYLEDIDRSNAEKNYVGPKEKFLKSLNMEFTISEASEVDLKRAEELTIRTHQLNATGCTYNYDELDKFRKSDNYKLLVCELKDKYGSYGKIGLSLIEIFKDHWHIRLLLMSCRVLSRGVGSILLSYIMQHCNKEGKRLLADFKETDKNRMMYVTYSFANFKEKIKDENNLLVLENDLSIISPFPPYIEINFLTENNGG